jgi:SNF2 family DNA or RNA helicase
MNAPAPLRQLGALPHPHIAQSGYDWAGGNPFHVQVKTVELLTENPRCFVLNSQGTGKTKAALWAFDYLQRVKAVKRMLVVAPLSTLRFTWAREIFDTIPRLKYVVVHAATKEKRRQLLAQPADVYIINHDGLKLLADEIMARKDIDVLCLDEIAIFRNRNKRTRICQTIARTKNIVWGMTGAPTPNAPTDVYQQAMIVCPQNVPKYFSTFRDMTMMRINQFKWAPRRGATETALRALSPQVRYSLDDVTELPPFVSRRQDIEIGPKQQKVYDDVRNLSFAALKSGEIRAANAGAVMSKLLQISIGWVYLSDGGIAKLDDGERTQALVDIVQASARKLLVFVPFKHALAGISDALNAHKISNLTMSGDTAFSDRDVIFSAFQNEVEPKVLVAHPQCLAHGVTLTAADTVVWFAPITSAEIYAQANARIRRIGQQHKQLFLHMQATPVEKHVYHLLINKIDGQDDLLKLLEQACRGEAV